MEALAQSRKWRGIAVAVLILTFGIVLGLKPSQYLRAILEVAGLLITMAAMCVAYLFDHISEFGRHRSIVQLLALPIICLVLLLQTAQRMATAMNLAATPLEAAMLGGFALGAILLIYGTAALQKIIPREKAAAASSSK